MTRKFFGTDGIRGKANKDPMTAEIALRLGMAAGRYFTRGEHRHAVVIGKDTRLSGYMLEPALTAGFISMGMDVILLGPLPTPAVAMLTRSLRADLGVMISASHNQYEDNGIKLFGPDGYKLSDDSELEIEALMEDADFANFLAPSAGLGKAWRLEDARGRYIEYAKATFPKGLRLDGMKIALDCANGAAYKVAPRVLWELGAEVFETGTSPNGININRNCGSQHINNLSQTVLANQADLGLALDGDADRLILCDEKGQTIDGDQIMALIASNWHKEGLLKGNKVVATLMSNLGLEFFLQNKGLELLRTQVGDRYVMEKMREGDYNLGGEQSGHIILSDYSTTGDGIIAALQVLAAIKDSGKPASQSLRLFDPLPQLLKNVKGVGDKELQNPRVQAAIKGAEERLKGQGRLLIRKSGTEAMVRVMAEAPDMALIELATEEIVRALRAV